MGRIEKVISRARRMQDRAESVAAAWAALEPASFDDTTLARARVVTRRKLGGGHHVPFDMLRTRLVRVMHDRGWRSIAVTSPTSGCGKTLTCLNLAFSLARREGGRTVLVELDLIKPAMVSLLGVAPGRSVGDFVAGDAPMESAFLRHGTNLALGLATQARRDSAEVLQSARCAEAMLAILDRLAPDIVLYDLPPVLAVDDAVAFASKADCALVVASEGESRLPEIDSCVAQLARVTTVVGVALNKSAFPSRGAYGYYGYGYGYADGD